MRMHKATITAMMILSLFCVRGQAQRGPKPPPRKPARPPRKVTPPPKPVPPGRRLVRPPVGARRIVIAGVPHWFHAGKYYKLVGDMLGVEKIPENQLPNRTKIIKEAAEAKGYSAQFERAEIATKFDESWNYSLENPFNHKHSKVRTNKYGQEQGSCIHLGCCNIGCEVLARNTLDFNYIPMAEHHGADSTRG